MSTENKVKGGLALIILAVAALIFFGTTYEGTGVVSDKWVETSTDCNDNGSCTTNHTYYVQLQDGSLYTLVWGTVDFDKIRSGDTIEFTSHGLTFRPLGIRIMVPAITTLKSVRHRG